VIEVYEIPRYIYCMLQDIVTRLNGRHKVPKNMEGGGGGVASSSCFSA